MKKKYQKPESRVVILKQRSHLLLGSPVTGMFIDDDPTHNWDPSGGQ
jgi:hypothetical protein